MRPSRRPFTLSQIAAARDCSHCTPPPALRPLAKPPRQRQGCPGKQNDCTLIAPLNRIAVIRFARAPLRPSGGEAGAPRIERVRWAMPASWFVGPLTLPFLPAGGGEGKQTALRQRGREEWGHTGRQRPALAGAWGLFVECDQRAPSCARTQW